MPRSKESQKATATEPKQPPRPPNAWIIFRSDMSKSMPPARPGESRPAQAIVSKAISKLWAEATPEIKAEYERRAEAAKLEHMIKFPEYRFAPMKKEDRIRLREEKKREKDAKREQSRRGRARPGPYTSHSQSQSSYFPPEDVFGAMGPSPPISAASSPTQTTFPDLIPTHDSSQPEPLTNGEVDAQADATAQPTWPSLESIAAIPSPVNGWPDCQQPHDMVTFNVGMLPGQSWNPSPEFDDHIHGFLSETNDPSIFNLSFDPQLLVSNPQGELNVSFGQSETLAPDFSNFDFSSLWQTPVQNGDALNPGTIHDLAPILPLHTDAPYNADDFINYDASPTDTTPEETPPSQSTTQPATPPPDTPKSYAPPAGAARASLRRPAGYWPSSFASSESTTMDISPPRFSVSAS